MGKRLQNQQNLTRRLKCLLVSFALLVPMCTWAEDYQLWVGQTQVNSENAADVLRNGTVSFSVATDPATGGSMNVLTLNGATIASGSIECGMDNLTIQLKGSNTVDNSIYYSGQTEGSSLTFTKDETETGICKLVIGNNSSQSAAIYGFSSLNYGSGMSLAAAYPAAYSSGGLYNTTNTPNVEYIRHATITSATVYPVWYNGEQVTSETAANLSNTDTPKVYFDIQTGTLTFDHSEQEYSEYAVAFDMSRFNVNLVGNNAITLSEVATAFKSYNADAGLKITTDEDNPGSMLVNYDGIFVDGMDMSQFSFVNGLVLEERTDGYTIAKAYDIWIGGTRVNTINRENVLGESVATVQFDGDHTLTLTGVTIDGGSIESGLENLTILLANDVSNPDETRSNNISSIVSTNKEATLTFGKVTTAESADLELSANGAVISGFASIDLGDMKWMYEGAPLIYKNNELVSASTGDPATWAALSSQGMEGEPILWIGDNPIVGDDTDGGDQTPATWSFVAETKTLTLSGASLSSPIITNFVGTLNIVLSGTNTIQNTDGPILPAAFVAYKSGVSLAFQEVEEATSAAKLTMTTTSAFDGFAKVSYSGNLALKKNNSGYEISNNSSGYGITIITGTNDGDIQITPSNRESILDGTIKFDGKNTLILDGATFAGISIESTNTLVDGLNVYLEGDNRIENGTNAIINYSSSMPLSIETDDIDPGTLIYINSTCSLKVANQAFSNFDPIAYKNGLVATLDKTDDEILANNSEITYDNPSYIRSQTVTIAVTMNPIVDAIGNKQVNVVGDLQTQGGSIPTTGVVLDNVLYTLSADGDGITVTDASGNAIPPVDQTVGITTTMTEEDVNTIAGRLADETLVPGTLEFAAAFKGMTFLLPAGTGNIIINVRTNESGTLAVKIGNQPAVTFDEAKTAFGELVVPFACSVPTYVLIYNQRAATESRELDSHRAPGRKETATVEIKGLSVSASSVVAVPEPALSPVLLDKSAVAKVAGKHFIKVDNPDVAGVDADAFVAVKEDKELTYVDLTNTGIKGITVDRSTDAFQNVPEKAFIYLPAGNKVKTGTKNVIIGSVCEDMEMADDAPYFEMAQDFTARNVKQNRDYKDFVGKNCTVYLPFAIDAETAASLGTFYELKGYDGTTVSMESVTETKANTPYMFKPKAADTEVAAKMVKVEATPAEAPVVGKAGKMIKFVGTYEKKDIVSDDGSSTQYYCFMADGAEAGKFVHVITTPVTMNPYRAYMVVEGGAVTARELDLVIDGVSTGIKNMKVGTDDNVYYDLQGRRVLYPTKGLYIVNGRKVIIK